MATDFESAVGQLIADSNIVHDVINGDAVTSVPTDNGDIPTLRKALSDNLYFQDPVAWSNGDDETNFNQIRTFTDGTAWWAPSATTLVPVPMGVTPYTDSNWFPFQDDNSGVKSWKSGFSVTDPKQPYVFLDDSLDVAYQREYIAPAASVGTPVIMGATPTGDSDWDLHDVVSSDLEGFSKEVDDVPSLKALDVDTDLLGTTAYVSSRKSRFILRSGDSPVAGDFGFIQSNTSNFHWEYYSDVINVKGFGAIGDRVNDDTSAIQAALDATRFLTYPLVPAVYIPTGVYKITSSLNVPGYANVYGDGYYSILEVDENLPLGTVLNVLTISENGANGLHIRDLSIWGQNNIQPNNPDVSAISIEPPLAVAIYNLFENLYIKEMSTSAVKISGAGMDNSSFVNCMFRDSKGPATVSSTSMNRVEFIGCRIRSGKDGICHGIILDGPNNRFNSIRDTRIEDNTGYGVVCTNGADSTSIENNNFLANALGGVLIDLSNNCIVSGNHFTSHLTIVFLDRSNSSSVCNNNAWDCNGDAIKLSASDSCTVNSNTIEGGTANAGAGIFMDVSDNCTVSSNNLNNIRGNGIVSISSNRGLFSSNNVYKAGQQASNTFFGFVLEGTSSFNIVTSNYVSSDAAPNLNYAVSNGGPNCNNNFIVDNRLSDGINGEVNDTGTDTEFGINENFTNKGLTGDYNVGGSTLTLVNGIITNLT